MIVSDSLTLDTSRDAHVGTWWFETVIVGTEWDTRDSGTLLSLLKYFTGHIHGPLPGGQLPSSARRRLVPEAAPAVPDLSEPTIRVSYQSQA